MRLETQSRSPAHLYNGAVLRKGLHAGYAHRSTANRVDSAGIQRSLNSISKHLLTRWHTPVVQLERPVSCPIFVLLVSLGVLHTSTWRLVHRQGVLAPVKHVTNGLSIRLHLRQK
jgi:hypothetical protein